MIHYSDGTETELMPRTAERAAMLIKITGSIKLSEFDYPLPESLTEINANVDLTNYEFPLPERLTRIDGDLVVKAYNHKLPEKLTVVDGSVYLINYKHRLPERLLEIGGKLYLRKYLPRLEEGLVTAECVYLDTVQKQLPPWILIPETTMTNFSMLAMYQNEEWRIIYDRQNSNILEALWQLKNMPERLAALKDLINQIIQSPLV